MGCGKFQEHHLWKNWEGHAVTTAPGSIKSVFVWGPWAVTHSCRNSHSISPQEFQGVCNTLQATCWFEVSNSEERLKYSLFCLFLVFVFNCPGSGLFSVSALWQTPWGGIPFILWLERVTACSLPLGTKGTVTSPLHFFKVQSMLIPQAQNLEDRALLRLHSIPDSRCAVFVIWRRHPFSCVHICTMWGSQWNPVILRILPGKRRFCVISTPPICRWSNSNTIRVPSVSHLCTYWWLGDSVFGN